MVNAFIEFVKEFRKKNPSMSYKDALQNASKEYKPSDKVKKTKSDDEKSDDKDKKNTRSRMIRQYKKLLDTVKKQMSRGELNKDDYDDLSKVGNQLRGKSTKNSYAKALKDLERKVKTKKFAKLTERTKKKTDKLKSDVDKQKKSNIERQLAKESENKSKTAMSSKKLEKQFDSYLGNLQPNDYLKLFMKKNPLFNKFRAEAYITKYKTYEKDKKNVPIVTDAGELKLADQPPPKVQQRVVVALPKLIETAVNEALTIFGINNSAYDLTKPLDINFYDFYDFKTNAKVNSLTRRLKTAINLLPSNDKSDEIFRNRIVDIVSSLDDYKDEIAKFKTVSSALISGAPAKKKPTTALKGKPLIDETTRIMDKHDITKTQAERVIDNMRISTLDEAQSVELILSIDTKQEVEQFLDFIESKSVTGIKDPSSKTALEFPSSKKVDSIKDFPLSAVRTEKNIAVDIKKAIKAKNDIIVEKLFRKQQTIGLKSETVNALRSRYGDEYDKALTRWEKEIDRITKLRDNSKTRESLDKKFENSKKVLEKIRNDKLPKAQDKYDKLQLKYTTFVGTGTKKSNAKTRRNTAKTELEKIQKMETDQTAKAVTAEQDIFDFITAKNTSLNDKEDEFTDTLKALEEKFFNLVVDANTKQRKEELKSKSAKPSTELVKARGDVKKIETITAMPELQRREVINRIEAEFDTDVPLVSIFKEFIPLIMNVSNFDYNGDPQFEKAYFEGWEDIMLNGIEKSTNVKITSDPTNQSNYLEQDTNVIKNADNIKSVIIAKLYPEKYALLQSLLQEGVGKPKLPESVVAPFTPKDTRFVELDKLLNKIESEIGNPSKSVPDILLAKELLSKIDDSNPNKAQLIKEFNSIEARALNTIVV